MTVGPRPGSGPQLASWWPHRFPEGLEDVSTYPVLIEELLRRGWREEELQGVLRGNLLRVFRQVKQVCWAGQKDGSVFQWVTGVGGWVLGKPLTADFHPQVREENSGQSPAEDEFPNRQVGRSCHSHLTRPQNEHLAAHHVGNKWPTNQALQRPSKASPHVVLGLMAAATFSILILWL